MLNKILRHHHALAAQQQRRGRPRRTRSRGDKGQAMLMALALIAVLAGVPAIVLGATVGQVPSTTDNLYWNAAYEAAQAGLNDYLQNLDANETFAQWSSGLSYTYYCTTPYPAGTQYDAAFCGWVPLTARPTPWSATSTPCLRRRTGPSVTVSGEAVPGSSCTGWPKAEGVLRTFTFQLAPEKSFLDDIYWTNYESVDPLFGGGCGGDGNANQAPNNGNWYQGASVPCPIWFFGNGGTLDDTVDGPLFSNDTLSVEGTPTFNGPVYSAAGSSRSLPGGGQASTEPLVVAANGDHTGCSGDTSAPHPNWNDGCPQNTSQQTAPSTAADQSPARNVGCYITGLVSGNTAPTWVDITLSESGSPATTTLTWTTDGSAPHPAQVDNTANNTNTCTSPISVSSLKSALIYVNGNVTVKGAAAGFLTIVAGDDDSEGPGNNPKSSAQSGYAGYMTINGNITYPAGDITGSGVNETDTADGLGLIAEYFVGIQNTLVNPVIDAAMLAVDGSVFVQNWDSSTAETGQALTVVGSIAQDFRGP